MNNPKQVNEAVLALACVVACMDWAGTHEVASLIGIGVPATARLLGRLAAEGTLERSPDRPETFRSVVGEGEAAARLRAVARPVEEPWEALERRTFEDAVAGSLDVARSPSTGRYADATTDGVWGAWRGRFGTGSREGAGGRTYGWLIEGGGVERPYVVKRMQDVRTALATHPGATASPLVADGAAALTAADVRRKGA